MISRICSTFPQSAVTAAEVLIRSRMEDEKYILHGPPESSIELKNLSVGQLILNQLTVHRSRVAQINPYTEERQTFGDILTASQKLATALRKEDIKENDCIAICSENNTAFAIPVCAAFFIGATVCPLNPLYSNREFIHALHITKPKYIFVSAISVKTICKIKKHLFWTPTIVMLEKQKGMDLPSIESFTSCTSIESNFQASPVNSQEHVAVICCSSGTTGLPKGVMLTDKNIMTMLRLVIGAMAGNIQENSISLAILPLFHVYSFSVFLVRLLVGNTTVVLSRFGEKIFLETIEKYRIQYLSIVPPLMVFLAKHPLVDKYDLSCVKEIWCGGAPLSKEIEQAVAKRFKLANGIKQGYGLTETTLAVIKSDPNGKKKEGSVGVLAPGVSAKVISPHGENAGKALGPNCEGELCFKGDLIMKGYCNDAKATALTIDKDGWLHSGDIGYYDEDGHFFIVDRLKELIKYKGFQVPPAELEGILLSCPGVRDAAVVGLPNEEAGELPFAFVVKQDGANVTAKEIIEYVNQRVSSHKRLRGGVRFVDSIPKTPAGKILRRVLRDALKSKL